MKLNRRNVLAGLGTAAAGTAAIFGTGAFVQETSTRDITVDVVDDDGDDVQLPIEPNDETANRITTDDDGVLHIDAENLPEDATVKLGDFDINDSMESDAGAFTVTNQNAFNADIELEITLDDAEGDFGEVKLAVGETADEVTDADSTTEMLGDGESVAVGILIETTEDLGEESELDETVTITLNAEVSE